MFRDYLGALARDNADLPSAYQAEVAVEAAQVWNNQLARRGIQKRRVLVVGGTGYIGVPVSHFLLSRGYEVVNVDFGVFGHQLAAASLLGLPAYTYHHADFADAKSMSALLGQVTDVVILAGLVGDPITKKYPELNEVVNEKGVRALIDACQGKGINKVIFISTCSNYGEIPEGVVANEDYELKPLSLYAQSKVSHERHLASRAWDFSYTVLRFATAFGLAPRMRFDLTVNQFTREMFLKQPLDVYDPDTWRPYCHVNDFARAIARVLEAPRAKVDRNVFNAGGEKNNFTKAMIVDAIKQRLPDAQYKLVTGGTDRRNYRVDFSRIRNTLHFEPKYSVADGIAELIAALDAGFFADHDQNKNYYGNYVVTYPGARLG